MITTNGDHQAKRALQVFEQVRSFFLQSTRQPDRAPGQVRILAFSSEREYKPYRFNPGAFAYYLHSGERDYIVMQDIAPEHYRVAVHEYTHLIVEHLGFKFPTWLNEGLAELYSSLEPHGRQTLVGRTLDYHVATLRERPLMPWTDLFLVDRQSPYYQEQNKMAVFYAQSWITVHMLSLSAEYRRDYPRFLASVGHGEASIPALQAVFHKTPEQIGRDVERYLQQPSVQAAVYDIALQRPDLEVKRSELSAAKVELALADLLATQDDRAPEARRRLTALSAEHQSNPDVESSLGYLDWGENRPKEARDHFRKALQRGSQDAHLIFLLAQLENTTGADQHQVMALLQQTLRLEPANVEVRLSIARLHAAAGHCEEALSVLSPVQSVAPGSAYRLFSMRAYCRVELKDYAEARKLETLALQYAATTAEREQVQRLTHALDQLQPSPTSETRAQ